MKKGIFFAIAFASLFIQVQAGIKVTFSDELAPLYPDSKIDREVTSFSLDAARGTLAGVHLLFNSIKPGTGIEINLTGLPVAAGGFQLYRLIEVPVAENTGLDSRTEKFSGQTNPYVIRKAPFRIYEAMESCISPIAGLKETEAFRLEFPLDSKLEPGTYNIRITLKAGSWKKNLDLTLNVYPVQVPDLRHAGLNYVNWHSNGRIAQDHGTELWSEPFWEQLGKYASIMAKGRQNTFWFIWSDFFRYDRDGKVIDFHEERFERYIRTFLNEGFTLIQGAPFARRRNWESDAFLLAVPTAEGKEIPMLSEEGLGIFRSMADSILPVLRKHGWAKQWVQGIFDEPTGEYIERYKATAMVLKGLDPSIRILEATMTVKLAGIVDCWCPQVQEYQAHKDFFESRRAAGDDIWVYTCLIPGGPWINRLVDQERLRQVYVGWACAKYDLQGFLHWGLNHHSGKPFEELVRQHGGPNNFLPAGDSHILYPGPDGPLSSLRFEAHRIGMEDYELLKMLKRINPSRAAEIMDALFKAFDAYNTSHEEYRKVKRQLLKSLS